MKNFTQQIKTAILLSALVLMAITVKAQKSNDKPKDFILTTEEKTIYIYGEKVTIIPVTGKPTAIEYTDENGKKAYAHEDEIKLMIVANRVYFGIPNNKGKIRMEQIITFNKKYILTSKNTSGLFEDVQVRSRADYSLIANEKLYLSKKKESLPLINDIMTNYFPECPEILNEQLKNIEKKSLVNSDISYYNCNNSPDLITNKEVKSSEVNEDITKAGRNNEFYVNSKGEKVEMLILNKDKKIFKNKMYARINSLNPVFKYNTNVSYFNNILTYKTESVPLTNLRYAFFEDELYGLVTQNGNKIMVKIHAFNNDYVLVGIMTAKKGVLSYDYAIYDRNKDNIVERTDDYKIPFLNNYFGKCTELKKMVDDNIKNLRNPTFGITYYNCNNSKEFIEGIKFE